MHDVLVMQVVHSQRDIACKCDSSIPTQRYRLIRKQLAEMTTIHKLGDDVNVLGSGLT